MKRLSQPIKYFRTTLDKLTTLGDILDVIGVSGTIGYNTGDILLGNLYKFELYSYNDSDVIQITGLAHITNDNLLVNGNWMETISFNDTENPKLQIIKFPTDDVANVLNYEKYGFDSQYDVIITMTLIATNIKNPDMYS